jgi:hypothetical protein
MNWSTKIIKSNLFWEGSSDVSSNGLNLNEANTFEMNYFVKVDAIFRVYISLKVENQWLNKAGLRWQ